MSDSTMPGGWSTFSSDIDEEQLKVFKAAMEGILGVHYTPVAVAQQVVAGMNYQFFCNAKEVYPNAGNEAAMVNISMPINKAPIVTGINIIPH